MNCIAQQEINYRRVLGTPRSLSNVQALTRASYVANEEGSGRFFLNCRLALIGYIVKNYQKD